MSHPRITTTSPGRIPVQRCSCTIARTGGVSCGKVISTTSSATGRTGAVSLAAERPARSPPTVKSPW
jgi:hypothetical protein